VTYDEDIERDRDMEARDEADYEEAELKNAYRTFDENHPPMPRG
jgi:hypothetical protein